MFTVTVTPAWAACCTRACNTAHASLAVIFDVSSPRSMFIALHTARNLASTASAAVSSLAVASAYALIVACACTFTSRPSHPAAASSSDFAEQALMVDAATVRANRAPGRYFKLFRSLIATTLLRGYSNRLDRL